ncbi:hypothetical protein B0H16DRAFT_524416 [Mycena metata]|uniref:Uncharacterized protein n=1 Tax=Mycena metata TaxID=1033252 RepID=A0AAD7H7M5_9AGAR|nr:hypothetical protein B0H16DRAFT_524416 [Mycena metata]
MRLMHKPTSWNAYVFHEDRLFIPIDLVPMVASNGSYSSVVRAVASGIQSKLELTLKCRPPTSACQPISDSFLCLAPGRPRFPSQITQTLNIRTTAKLKLLNRTQATAVRVCASYISRCLLAPPCAVPHTSRYDRATRCGCWRPRTYSLGMCSAAPRLHVPVPARARPRPPLPASIFIQKKNPRSTHAAHPPRVSIAPVIVLPRHPVDASTHAAALIRSRRVPLVYALPYTVYGRELGDLYVQRARAARADPYSRSHRIRDGLAGREEGEGPPSNPVCAVRFFIRADAVRLWAAAARMRVQSSSCRRRVYDDSRPPLHPHTWTTRSPARRGPLMQTMWHKYCTSSPFHQRFNVLVYLGSLPSSLYRHPGAKESGRRTFRAPAHRPRPPCPRTRPLPPSTSPVSPAYPTPPRARQSPHRPPPTRPLTPARHYRPYPSTHPTHPVCPSRADRRRQHLPLAACAETRSHDREGGEGRDDGRLAVLMLVRVPPTAVFHPPMFSTSRHPRTRCPRPRTSRPTPHATRTSTPRALPAPTSHRMSAPLRLTAILCSSLPSRLAQISPRLPLRMSDIGNRPNLTPCRSPVSLAHQPSHLP